VSTFRLPIRPSLFPAIALAVFKNLFKIYHWLKRLSPPLRNLDAIIQTALETLGPFWTSSLAPRRSFSDLKTHRPALTIISSRGPNTNQWKILGAENDLTNCTAHTRKGSVLRFGAVYGRARRVWPAYAL
jgi:hypothetical protein